MKIIAKTSLAYQDGRSDKVYMAELVHDIDNSKDFMVNFAYGRRGANLNTGSKTSQPVSEAKARAIYDKLIAEKRSKGYQVIASHVSAETAPALQIVSTENLQPLPGRIPQLLNPIGEDHLDRYLADDGFVAQEKFDGIRLMVGYQDGKLLVSNRRGLPRALNNPEMEEILTVLHSQLFCIQAGPRAGCETKQKAPIDFLFDGELVGDIYYVFDVLSWDQQDLRKEAYLTRQLYGGIFEKRQIEDFLAPRTSQVVFVRSVQGTAKTLFVQELREQGKEGVVFKDLRAPYAPGRPNAGGSQVKYKFQASATCRVARVNDKRSVSLEVLRDGTPYLVGNCTIPANHQVPQPGQLVEIRYLYAYPAGSLYQPVYLGQREDQTEMDTYDSLKFKAVAESA